MREFFVLLRHTCARASSSSNRCMSGSFAKSMSISMSSAIVPDAEVATEQELLDSKDGLSESTDDLLMDRRNASKR